MPPANCYTNRSPPKFRSPKNLREDFENTTDWRALMPDVAKALLGDPPKHTAREWRYGDKGSLKINLEAGTW